MTKRLVAAVAVWLVVGSTPAAARVDVDNLMSTEVAATAGGLAIHRYGSGAEHLADFTVGDHDGTVDAGGSLELDLDDAIGTWWDLDFTSRQCFTVTSPTSLAAYQVRLDVDTSATASTGADVRVVEGLDGPLLTSFSHGPFPAGRSLVYARIEPLPAGSSTYCVYFDNSSAVSVSDEAATFAATPGQPMRYYTMLPTFSGGAADRRVEVVAYTDGTVVSSGATTVTLDAGDTATLSGLTRQSVITATGPIEAQANRNGKETLLPESYAASRFSFATTRYVERFYVRSPFAPTTIEAVANGVVVASVDVEPADGVVEIAPNNPANQYVSLRSTDGTDFLAMHRATNDGDVFIGVPWTGDTLYGVASTLLNFGALTPTTVSWVRHDGASNPAQTVAANTLSRITGHGARGNGRAYAIDGSSYFAAIQQADQNGAESTSFYPAGLLGATYRLPIRSNYVAVACPVPGTLVSVNGGAPTACAGVGVGHWWSGLGNFPAGTLIEADQAVFAYNESRTANDEHNLLGMKASTPRVPGLSVVAGPVEELTTICGEWLSPVLATGGVFGLASLVAVTPPDTTIAFQISTDGSPFYGRDGTGATSFDDGRIIPYVADGASTLQLRLELCADDPVATPTVDVAGVEYDLAELAVDLANRAAVTLTTLATPTTEPVLRVYQNAGGSWSGVIDFRDGTNLAEVEVDVFTDHPSLQVEVTGGTVTAPGPAFSHTTAEPYSVTVVHTGTPGVTSEVEIALVDMGLVRIEAGVRFSFVGS